MVDPMRLLLRANLTAALSVAILVCNSIAAVAQESDPHIFYDDPTLGHDIRYVWTHGDPTPFPSTHTQVYDGAVLADGSMALLVDDADGTAIYRFGAGREPHYRGSTLAEHMMGSARGRLLFQVPATDVAVEGAAPADLVVRRSNFEYIRTTASGVVTRQGSLRAANVHAPQILAVGPGGTVYAGGTEDEFAPNERFRRAIVARFEADDRLSWEWTFAGFPDGSTRARQILPLADGSVLVAIESEAVFTAGVGPRGQPCGGEPGYTWLIHLDAAGLAIGTTAVRLDAVEALAQLSDRLVLIASVVHLAATCDINLRLVELELATGQIIRDWYPDVTAKAMKSASVARMADASPLKLHSVEQIQVTANAIYLTVSFVRFVNGGWRFGPNHIVAIEPNRDIGWISGSWREGFNLGVLPDDSAFLLSHRYYLLAVPMP